MFLSSLLAVSVATCLTLDAKFLIAVILLYWSLTLMMSWARSCTGDVLLLLVSLGSTRVGDRINLLDSAIFYVKVLKSLCEIDCFFGELDLMVCSLVKKHFGLRTFLKMLYFTYDGNYMTVTRDERDACEPLISEMPGNAMHWTMSRHVDVFRKSWERNLEKERACITSKSLCSIN